MKKLTYPSSDKKTLFFGTGTFILLVPAILFFLLIIASCTVAQITNPVDEEDEEPVEKPDLVKTLKNDTALLALSVVGITSLIVYIPVAIRNKHIQNMEDALPEVLNEIAENIRSGRSVESAFKEVADVRDDRLGNELKRASEEMLHTSFEAAMRAFAQRTGSRAIIRIISLVLIAVDSGASLANVLEKIANELWEVYILKKDREAKSGTNASVILWGGATFTPAIIGFILGVFNSNESVTIDVGPYDPVFKYFLMTLGLISIVMRGVAMGTMKEDIIRSPFFFWLPGIIYVVVKESAGMILG